jgi:hypothetical protein
MSNQLLDIATKHTRSLGGFLDKVWNQALETAFRTGWKPITGLAEAVVVA